MNVWRGHHGDDLAARVTRAWDRNELLVLCPPALKDFSFRKVPLDSDHVLGVFTSGTLSATPRLVLYTKANILASLDAVFGLFDRHRIEHVFCYPQAFHTFGLTLGYVAAHVHGWRLHTPIGKYSAASHAQRLALREDRVLTLGTPTHFFDLARIARDTGIAPSYSCIIGGASVSRELWRSVRDDLRIEAPSVGYGCTEASPAITHLAPGLEPAMDGDVGAPLGNLDARLVKDGVEISGPSLCSAIIQNGALARPRSLVIRDRLVEQNGRWRYEGRLDLTLNRGGQKFSLEAIERELRARLATDVVACSVRDARLGEDLGLMIQSDSPALVVTASSVLRDEFGLRLNPERARLAREFPLNECSKLDRRAVAREVET